MTTETITVEVDLGPKEKEYAYRVLRKKFFFGCTLFAFPKLMSDFNTPTVSKWASVGYPQSMFVKSKRYLYVSQREPSTNKPYLIRATSQKFKP
jgi:hypothetical protein